MSIKRFSFGFLLFVVFSLLLGERAIAFYCGSHLVSVGDSKSEVQAKCGKPSSKEGRSKAEEWTYDSGPQSFVQILTFRGSRLVGMETGGYGSGPNKTEDAGCERSVVSVGETKKEVQAKCGKPTSKEVIKRKQRGAKNIQKLEEWRYNLGPDRLVRLYQFDNGRLVSIETGGYGK
jgi:hypothetical protein